MRGSLVALLLTALIAAAFATFNYDGYQVYRTPILDKAKLEILHRHILSNPEFQIWAQPQLNEPAEILVSPNNRAKLLRLLNRYRIKPHLFIDNVGKILDDEQQKIDDVRVQEIFGLNRNVTFERYMDLDEISEYIDEVILMNPTIATNEIIGFSYEGRPQTVLKLSTGGEGKVGIFIDAAIHSAEWLGPAVALNAIFQLTANLTENQVLLDMADWYILPVANPDGYVHTWTEDRLWRKTRRPNVGSQCYGADPNRNFDIHWGEGGEKDPCVWNYPGPNLYSEIESRNIAEYLLDKGLSGSVHLYMAMHTFGQYLLHPYGYSNDLPPNFEDIVSAATDAVDALESVRGTEYTVGSIANILYLAFGNSQDFAYDEADIPYAFTWELPRGGVNGHDPPPSEIKPVVDETWEAIKVLVQHVFDVTNSTFVY